MTDESHPCREPHRLTPTDQGEKVGMWTRRGDHHSIIVAGNYRNHEMVVRHEMLHSLIGQSADAYGYNPLFIALAALDLVGAVVLWSLLRGRKAPQA